MRKRKTIDFAGIRVRKPYASRFYALAAQAAYAVNNGLAPKRWAEYWWEVCQSINTREEFLAWYNSLTVT